MIKNIFAIVCTILIFHANAQSKKYAVKLYNLSTYEQFQVKYTQPQVQTTASSNLLNLLHPTIGIQWNQKKRRTGEIELTNFSIQHLDDVTKSHIDSLNQTIIGDAQKNTRVQIGLRYEQIYALRKNEHAKLQFHIGYGFNPYYILNHLKPYGSGIYKRSTADLGIRAFFIPRITYNLSSRLFLDVNLPICVANMYMEAQKLSDPSLPQLNQTNTTFNFDAMPSFFSGRIGFGIRL